MKKVLFVFLTCFLLVGCFEKNGETKKFSLKTEEIKTEKKVLFKKVREKRKEISSANKEREKEINNSLENIAQEYDEFNQEYKWTHFDAKNTDKIKVELYGKMFEDEDEINSDSFSMRGNIFFSCVSKEYFYFDRIVILADNNRYEIKGDIFSQDSERKNGNLIKTAQLVLDSDKTYMMYDIADSKSVKIRFTKDDKNKDFTLTREERQKIKDMCNMISAYFSLKSATEELLK